MKHFTPEVMYLNETFKPRQQTLDVIRQFAHTYRTNANGAPCLN